jgi:hypothetical protein
MNWPAISTVSDLIGAIVVVVTLCYVAVQLRQNTKAIRIREFAWHQYKAGSLDEESWQSYMAPVAGLFSTKRARGVLEFYTGSPEFLRLIAERVNGTGG